jgi:hypothetical protein
MEVRQSTKEKIKQAVTIVCENQKQNGVKWMTINQKLREIKGNILIPQIMRSAGYLIYVKGKWFLNPDKTPDIDKITESILQLYIQRKTEEYARRKQKNVKSLSVPSLASVLSQLPEDKFIEEAQRRGYIIFKA